MTVKARVRNRKAGVSVNVEINNKSEANNHSKNRYIPQLQSNIDDQEPPSQASIQNIIPYFNKAPSLPMYNNEGLGIPSRYGSAATQPQGSTEIPSQYNPDQVAQDLAPKTSNVDEDQASHAQASEDPNIQSEISEGFPLESADLEPEPPKQGGSRPLPEIAQNDWDEKLTAKYKAKSDEEQKKFLILFNGNVKRLQASFKEVKYGVTPHILTRYGLWPMLERAYNANELSPESEEYYEPLLRKKWGLR